MEHNTVKCGECNYFGLYSGRDMRKEGRGYCKKFTVDAIFRKDTLCFAPEEIFEEEAQRIDKRSW